MSAKGALDVKRGDKVFVRYRIPGASEKKNLIKEAKVIKTVGRGAQLQIDGDNLPRHMPWNSIALRPEDFDRQPLPSPVLSELDAQRIQEEMQAEDEPTPASTPSPMEEEVSSFDGDLSDWMSMGDDLVGGFLRKRDTLAEERKGVQEMIDELEARRTEIDAEVQVLGTRINKANELLKALRKD